MIVTDGTVVWIVDDLRDGTPVGAVRGSLYLPAGYVKANGATVQRADYPRLVALADRHRLWTDDVTANAGLFGRGDGASTMVLPNWINRMVQLAGDNAGATVAAGLPNITGRTFNNRLITEVNPKDMTSKSEGAILRYDLRDVSMMGVGVAGNSIEIGIDASKSNPIYGRSDTVQPAAIKLIPIIRY